VFLGAVLVLSFIGDYGLRLPLGVRQIALFATLVGLATVVFRRLVRPLRESLSDAILATRVEERYPELEDRLVSSLAFLEASNDPDNEDSPALMRAVIEETARMTPGIRFSDVAHARVPLRWAAGAGAVVLCAATAALAQPQLAETYLQRDILLRDVAWPRRTTLRVVDMEPGSARTVTLHHDTLIRIRAEGAVPERIEMRFREIGSDDDDRIAEIVEIAPAADDPSLFTFNLHVDADYEFVVTGGDDDRAEVYRIQALTPPAVVGIEMRCTYAAYLGREDEVLTDGDQRVPEGTVIELRATVNMELTEARIQIAGVEPTPLERVGDRVYRARLEPKKDLRYAFLLAGPHGERNEPHTFVLRVSKDRAPDLRVRAPSARAERALGGVALIAFSARDDHRIAEARFSYRVGDDPERTITLGSDNRNTSEAGNDGAIRFLRAPDRVEPSEGHDLAPDTKPGSKSAAEQGETLLGLVAVDLARLKRADGNALQKDAVITYRIEVTDSAGKVTKTRAGRQLHATADSEIELIVEGRQRDLREGVERSETQAATVRVELGELGTASPTGALTEADIRRQLGRTQAATARLIDQLSLVSGHLRSLVNLYVFNRLDDAATANQVLPFFERHLLQRGRKNVAAFRGSLYRDIWRAQQESRIRAGGAYLQLLEMADLSDRLSSEYGPAAYGALRDAGRGIQKTGSADPIRVAAREQERIDKGLERLRRLMREWQSYEGVVRGIRRLREDEARIVEELTHNEKKR